MEEIVHCYVSRQPMENVTRTVIHQMPSYCKSNQYLKLDAMCSLRTRGKAVTAMYPLCKKDEREECSQSKTTATLL